MNATKTRLLMSFVVFVAVWCILLHSGLYFNHLYMLDGDVFWHLRAGQWIVAHGQLPGVDSFSANVQGHPWLSHYWLTEVLFYYLNTHFGLAGIFTVTIAVVALTVSMMMFVLQGSIVTRLALLLSFFSFSLIKVHLIPRPHIMALPLLFLWVVGLLHAREQHRSPSLYLLLPYILLANLHGVESISAFFIAAAFALEALIYSRAEAQHTYAHILRTWGGFLLLTFAVSILCTPQGGLTWDLFIHFFTDKRSNEVNEWAPVSIGSVPIFAIWFFGLLFLGLRSRLSIPLYRLLLLLGIMYLAVRHIYFATYFALLGSLLVVKPLQRSFSPRWDVDNEWMSKRFAALLFLAVSLGGGAYTFYLLHHLPRTLYQLPMAPDKAVDKLEQAGVHDRIFNYDGFGGYLIYRSIRPYIDTRFELYSLPAIKEYGCVSLGGIFLMDFLQQHAIEWVLFPPDALVTSTLETMPQEWKMVYHDSSAVLFHRITQSSYSGAQKNIKRVAQCPQN